MVKIADVNDRIAHLAKTDTSRGYTHRSFPLIGVMVALELTEEERQLLQRWSKHLSAMFEPAKEVSLFCKDAGASPPLLILSYEFTTRPYPYKTRDPNRLAEAVLAHAKQTLSELAAAEKREQSK